MRATAYSHVKKWDPEKGSYRLFTAERAVGSGVEAVHQLAKDEKWLLAITSEDEGARAASLEWQLLEGSQAVHFRTEAGRGRLGYCC